MDKNSIISLQNKIAEAIRNASHLWLESKKQNHSEIVVMQNGVIKKIKL